MNKRFKVKKIIRNNTFLLICLFILFFQSNSEILNALQMENHQNGFIIEELRLKVPSKFKEVWLEAENKVWEPWLSIQEGFLGRQLFWDKEKEEALILVNWKSKKLWKSIPMSEVNVVQQKFEDNVKAALNVRENPFKLIYEGELDKQK
ncbi:MAG: TIGR03792 family protein [Prochlorococcus marinus CUG1435]|nr:TIGR03792 family protein [Prochlorococcus marinus CUG1435]